MNFIQEFGKQNNKNIILYSTVYLSSYFTVNVRGQKYGLLKMYQTIYKAKMYQTINRTVYGLIHFSWIYCLIHF